MLATRLAGKTYSRDLYRVEGFFLYFNGFHFTYFKYITFSTFSDWRAKNNVLINRKTHDIYLTSSLCTYKCMPFKRLHLRDRQAGLLFCILCQLDTLRQHCFTLKWRDTKYVTGCAVLQKFLLFTLLHIPVKCQHFLTYDLISMRTFPDLWLTCDHFVGKVSAMGQQTRPTQPSIPAGSVN